MEFAFYLCPTCGKLVSAVKDTRVPLMCCGLRMQELVPNTAEASREKHMPVYTAEGNTVTVRVASAEHPMEEEHFIEWVAIWTVQGGQLKTLQPGQAPAAAFALTEDDELKAVYAYCNAHGLWKA